jgi:chaperone required for assembly of F1-ATPase
MSNWRPKRFWKAASVVADEGGFAVHLDGRPVKTPAKQPLLLPTHALATLVAAEWDAQSGLVNPETMPVTRMANSAIDKVVSQYHEVATLLTAYGETDHLCYRATHPPALAAQQALAWDPLLEWAAESLQAPLKATAGIAPIAQDPTVLARLHDQVLALGNFKLAAFHDLVSISGSLVLAFAVGQGRLTAEEGWHLSRLDESWQIALWGEDEDAAAAAALKREAFHLAARFFALCA